MAQNARTEGQFNRVQGLFERTKVWRENTDSLMNAFKSVQMAEEVYFKSLSKISKSLKAQKFGHGIDTKGLGVDSGFVPADWTLSVAWSSLLDFMDSEVERRQAASKHLSDRIMKPLSKHSRDVNAQMKQLTTRTQEMFDAVGTKKEEMQEAYKQRRKAVEDAVQVRDGPITVDPWLFDIQYYSLLEKLAQTESEMSRGMAQLQDQIRKTEEEHVNTAHDCIKEFLSLIRTRQASCDQSLSALAKGTHQINMNHDLELVQSAYGLGDLKMWAFDYSHVPKASDHRESSVLKSGSLQRLGSILGLTWRREHFELSPTGFLYAFEKPGDTRPSLALSLLEFCSVRRSQTYPAGFELVYTRPGGALSLIQPTSTYLLCADTEEEMMHWFNAISKITTESKGRRLPFSPPLEPDAPPPALTVVPPIPTPSIQNPSDTAPTARSPLTKPSETKSTGKQPEHSPAPQPSTDSNS